MEKTNTTLYVKNMVCPRCIKVLADELSRLGIENGDIQLGRIQFSKNLSSSEFVAIKVAIEKNGFELLNDKKMQLIEKIKLVVLDYIRSGKLENMEHNFSKIISEEVHLEYTQLSSLFSAEEGKTIERFIIQQKVERIKELISYDELSIKQIAAELGYSSLQALSSQFKKETGLTPSEFKKLSSNQTRKSIDNI